MGQPSAFRSINHPLSREMIPFVNPNFCVSVSNTLRSYIKRLVDLYRQFSEDHEKGYCSLMIDGPEQFGSRFLAITMFTEGCVLVRGLEGPRW
jgi:hypothetical protein